MHKSKILITGATGLVGEALIEFLKNQSSFLNTTIYRLTRSPKEKNDLSWDYTQKQIDPRFSEGFDAIIHLAGENVAGGLWTKKRKQAIVDSRVVGTRFLVEEITKLQKKPKCFLQASAIGFYGDRGNETLTEESLIGEGFLADTCQAWEKEGQPLSKLGIAVSFLRTSLVLSTQGGFLARLLPAYKLNLGARLGSNNQYLSWIHIHDLIQLYIFILENRLSGVFNATAPTPQTNLEFSQTLARILNKKAFLKVPKALIQLMAGKTMANELLLASAKVLPKAISKKGFQFSYPDLESALKNLL